MQAAPVIDLAEVTTRIRGHLAEAVGLDALGQAAPDVEISPLELIALIDQVEKLRTFHRQVVRAARSLEGLPDGHAFELIWAGGDGAGGARDGFITAGMIRRAAPPVPAQPQKGSRP
ncbi:MAG: hypothetical protein ACRC67_18190 [Inquilinus sp.]|uniref:hypothetical protein n=1 Tax=Inquilinus sp. TaxID=1932117 RepID=UPI003F3B0A73